MVYGIFNSVDKPRDKPFILKYKEYIRVLASPEIRLCKKPMSPPHNIDKMIMSVVIHGLNINDRATKNLKSPPPITPKMYKGSSTTEVMANEDREGIIPLVPYI